MSFLKQVKLVARLSLGEQGRRTNDVLVDRLLGDILPIDKLDGPVGALHGATAARDALRGFANNRVDLRHVPRASLVAQSAADAFIGIDHARAGLGIGVDGMHRAVLHASRIFALLAMLNGELAVAIDSVGAV